MALYKYDHIHFTSPDLMKIIEFYTQVMGARIINETEINGRKLIDLDVVGLHVRISTNTKADDNWQGFRFGLHHIGLVVNNLDEAAIEMSSKGAEFVVNPYHPQPGIKVAFIKAPGDVLFEIIEKKE